MLDNPIMTKDEDGTKRWTLDNKAHREDGPAIIFHDGSKEWLINGEYHREDGPAIKRSSGLEGWYICGKLHREDGPAVITSTYTSWYRYGERHRTNGPSVEYTAKRKPALWYVSGQRIRNKMAFRAWSGISDEEMTMLILKYGDIGVH